MADPRKTAAELARALETRLGERLHSVLLFGSVARGEAVEGVSDINILVLLDRVDAAALEATGPLARRWANAGNTVPLVMAEDEWRRAADVFAIELSDMKDAHVILHGRDPLVELEVDPAALRLQVEREIRGKLLQLREGMLVSAEDEAALGRLLMVALPSFVTYLRATLRLLGQPVPMTSPEVITEAARRIGFSPRPLLQVWEARATARPLHAGVADPLVRDYYAVAETTAAFVDQLSESRSE